MIMRITWGRLRAGAWSEFERTYRAKVIDTKRLLPSTLSWPRPTPTLATP